MILIPIFLQFFKLNPQQVFQTTAAPSPPLLLPNLPPFCVGGGFQPPLFQPNSSHMCINTLQKWELNSWGIKRNSSELSWCCLCNHSISSRFPLPFQTEKAPLHLQATSSKAQISLQCTSKCKLLSGIPRELHNLQKVLLQQDSERFWHTHHQFICDLSRYKAKSQDVKAGVPLKELHSRFLVDHCSQGDHWANMEKRWEDTCSLWWD